MIVSKSVAETFLGKNLKSLGHGSKSYYVLSKDGSKNLGGPYTREDAVHRLQQIEYFKHNPESFLDKNHNWNEILISNNKKKLTRRQILNYYNKNEKKIWPFIKNQTVMIILGVGKNNFIIKRHGRRGEFIKLDKLKGIDDPNSFEYWTNRRAIEFHPTLMSKTTPILWLDLDIHSTKDTTVGRKLIVEMKRSIPILKKILKDMGVRKVYVYKSGTGRGIHLEGNLSKPENVDVIRKKFTGALSEHFSDSDIFTTGIASPGQIRLDTTTFHKLGSLRAPYSLTKDGMPKVPL